MKITSLKLAANQGNGLSSIEMSRLSSIVLIAGKNGAGKSRLLASIKSEIQKKPTKRNIDIAKKNIERFKRNRINILREKKALDQLLEEENTDPKISTLSAKAQVEDSIISLDERIDQQEKVLNWDLINTDNYSDNYSSLCVDFVPKSLTLADCNAMSKIQMRQTSDKVATLGVGHLSSGVLSKIQIVQDRWYETSHQESTSDVSIKHAAESDYKNLCKTIYSFLGAHLDRSHDGDATLFGRGLGKCALSQGQTVLLQLCVAIYSQEEKLDELILFLDEPENHLHPAALIEVMESLEANLKSGQLWVATHSVHLLSHFESSCIWYMDNGSISHSGSKPEQVLDGLIGGDERIGKLTEFLTLPAELAQSRFALQSLFPPETVGYLEDDPQANQVIAELIRSGDKTRVLDFGAGKARLLSAAESYSFSKGIKVSDWLDYYAFDLPDSDDSQFAKELIKEVYGGTHQRYFNNEQTLIAALDKESCDYILMCNVFHELDPVEWTTIFNEHSIVRSLIKSDGHLMVIEDQRLPVGEKAYKNGFLVFDEVQFQKLFNIQKYDIRDAREDGRLKAHLLPSSCLSELNNDTKKIAIENLRHFAKQKIARLRAEEPNYSNGRLHGFWIQQYANAGLCLN